MQPNDQDPSGHRPLPDDVPSLDPDRLEVPTTWDPLDPAPLDDTERHELERFLSTDDEAIRVSDDFVANTLARVMADQEEIRHEAQVEDEASTSDAALSELLKEFRAPEPSADFVESTLRAAVPPTSSSDEELAGILSEYGPNSVSPEFVQRTLDALQVDRSPLRLVREDSDQTQVAAADTDESERAKPKWTPRGAILRLAAAALFTAGIVVLAQGDTTTNNDANVATSTDDRDELSNPGSQASADTAVSAVRFAPAPGGRRLGRIDDDGLSLDPIDPLYAAFGVGDTEDGR